MNEFLQARDLLLRYRSDYERAYREFAWPVLDNFNWALDYFDVLAQGNDNPALWIVDSVKDHGRRYSFAQTSERSSRIANFLRELGVRRGDHVLLMLDNCVELWDVMLALMKLGSIVLPASTQLSAEDISDRISVGGIQHVVAGRADVDKFSKIDSHVTRISVGEIADGWIDLSRGYQSSAQFLADGTTKASDTMLMYFTSGTASKPKLVVHTHQSYPVGHLSTMYWIGLQAGDIHWNISSPGWAKHAWSSFFAPWNAQACVFAFNYRRFLPKEILDLLVSCEISTLCAPPTVWRMLIQEPLETYKVKLREIVSAGEPLNAEIIKRVQDAWGVPVRDGFGQTETTCQIGNSPGQVVVPGSMGRPLPGYSVELIDADGQRSHEGEIVLNLADHPLGLMTCYANSDHGNANAMRQGLYHTCDLAVRREGGYYLYIGRNDDVFKSSDYRLSPFELESILIEHESVAEAAVVPSPDLVRLAVAKAYITLSQDCEPSPEVARSIFRFARHKLAPYKRIRRLQFSDLPKTISGKIRRAELRARELERASDRFPNEYWEEDFQD